jgi:hypothetical protein
MLLVVLHDTMEWWCSDFSFEELRRRVGAFDEDLEEEVYSRNQKDCAAQKPERFGEFGAYAGKAYDETSNRASPGRCSRGSVVGR